MKYTFAIINILLITTIAYVGVDIAYKKLSPETIFLENESSASNPEISKAIPAKKTFGRDKMAIIMKRNLFGAELAPTSQFRPAKETGRRSADSLKPTRLNLRLCGTVTGGSDIYAVIEDKKSRKQALFQVGDTIAGASIQEIMRNKVILSHKGKDQILEIDTDTKDRPLPKTGNKKLPQNIPDSKSNIPLEAIKNTTGLTSQIKFRPHVTDGQPGGLMIYGITSRSMFRKIGLRNGDIIKKINEIPITLKEDSSVLFSEIEQADELQITLLRRGKVKTLSYQGQ